MNRMTRKQREVQERDREIRKVASKLLLEKGYLGFGMDTIAESMEYSKGTIYQHYSSKEDLLLAISCDTLEHRMRYFQRGLLFGERPRFKLLALAVAYDCFERQFPEFSRIQQLIHVASIADKASETTREKHNTIEALCFGMVQAVVEAAVRQQDLVIASGFRTSADLTFALWSLTFGAFFLLTSGSGNMQRLGISRPQQALHAAQMLLLDGCGWKPLSHEVDYELMRAKIAREIFDDDA